MSKARPKTKRKAKAKKGKTRPKPKAKGAAGGESQRRIAMVSTHGYVAADAPLGAPDTGGQVVYVLELAKKLSQFGYKVDIWTRRFEGQPEMDKVNSRVRVLRAPCGGDEFIPKEYLYEHMSEWAENALEYIRKNKLKYDFVNSHYWDAGVGAEQLVRVLNCPHIHTPHSIGTWKKQRMHEDFNEDDEHFEQKYNFSNRIRHERLLYHECDMVTATTPIQVNKIKSDYDVPEDQVRFIPPGYDDNKFFPVGGPTRQMIRERLGYSGKVVYAVSRLARNKGFDLLIHGFSVLAEREPEAKLVLAIGHEDRDEVEEEIYQELVALRKQYGLEDRVVFTGYISDEEMADYYRAADIFVLSSRYEPFGMTAVEAMACGTPVAATIHGGLFRIFHYGDQCLFADPFDKEDLGVTMLKILRYKDLRGRLARHGARMARARFTWTSVAQQLLNLADQQFSGELMVHVKPEEHIL